MNLTEYQSRKIFKKYNIAQPPAYLATSVKMVAEKARRLGPAIGLKANVPFSGRGKLGLVKFGPVTLAEKLAKQILHKNIKEQIIKEVLVVKACPPLKKFYLGVTIDQTRRQPLVLFSPAGGVNIEDTAQKHPTEIYRKYITANEKLTAAHWPIKQPLALLPALVDIANKLINLARSEETLLAEINPLGLMADGALVALDAKIILDDNAAYRHPDWPRPKKAIPKFSYVPLGGRIGVIGNGAGLVMATIDLLKAANLPPANFLDLGGGADRLVMQKALEIVLAQPRLQAIFVNVFGGITRTDEIGQGLVKFKKEHRLKIPLVVRLIGTNEEKAKRVVNAAGLNFVDSLEEGVKMLRILIKQKVQ